MVITFLNRTFQKLMKVSSFFRSSALPSATHSNSHETDDNHTNVVDPHDITQWNKNTTPIEWSEFQATVPMTRIKRIVFSADLSLAMVYGQRSSTPRLVSIHDSLQTWLLADLLEKKVPYRILKSEEKRLPLWLRPLLPAFFSVFSTLFFSGLLMGVLSRRISSMSSTSTRSYPIFRPTLLETQTWIGSPEVLNECMETVRGDDGGIGREWRGLLLEGEPGTGKTLLARKIAAEANASFIPVVGSQFVEVYVGVGAKRVRDLFSQAREHTPVIVFIDEMDAIAGKRGLLHNSEADNTLNQLLAEMDGFRHDHGVFVLGATNRVSLMDPALLRPGRFDRVVHIPLPDAACRRKMFTHFLGDSVLDVSTDMDYETLGVLSEGFSGAVIEKVVREAEIFARRNDETVLEPRHMDLAMEKEWVGLLKTEEDRSPQEILRVAVHEMGHALLAHRFFRVHKISIRNNHKGMGGFTLYDPSSVEDLPTRETLQQRVTVLLGGRAAERLWYGPMATSTGAVQDLASANELAEAMIMELGFSERFPSLSSRTLAWSEGMRDALHDEVQGVLDQGLREATHHLNETWGIFQKLVVGLVESQSMNESVFLSYIV